jgi:hypothetical protein
MRRLAAAFALVGGCALVAGCATPANDDRPVVHIAEAAKPSESRPLGGAIPTADELSSTLGAAGFMGQLVDGGADMLLAGVGESGATPTECVGAAHSLQRVVYQGGPVRDVASQSWAGGPLDGPPRTGFFGAVRFATPDAARAFFAASADSWHRCNGQTVVLQQPEHSTQSASRIADVTVDESVLSAIVMRDGGATIQRALGVAGDCVVDVELSTTDQSATARAALDVAALMLRKIGHR